MVLEVFNNDENSPETVFEDLSGVAAQVVTNTAMTTMTMFVRLTMSETSA